MEVPKVDLNSQLANRISKLRLDIAGSIAKGDYRAAREAHKEYAKISIENFYITTKVPVSEKTSFDLFSKEGWNAIKFAILEKFRRKTPEEKTLERLYNLYKEGIIEL